MAEWDGQTERRQPLMEYQHAILDRLTKIEVEFSFQRSLMKDIARALSGNGKEGLLIRHDRVERVVQMMCWALGVTAAAVITMLVKQAMG